MKFLFLFLALSFPEQVDASRPIPLDYQDYDAITVVPEGNHVDVPEAKLIFLNQKPGDYTIITVKNNVIKTHPIKVGTVVPSIADAITEIFKDNPDDAERFAGAYAAVDLSEVKTYQDLTLSLRTALQAVGWTRGKYPKLVELISANFPDTDDPIDPVRVKSLIDQIIKGAKDVRMGVRAREQRLPEELPGPRFQIPGPRIDPKVLQAKPKG